MPADPRESSAGQGIKTLCHEPMTALVFIIQPQQVCLAMDTLVVGADDKMPLSFQRKFLSVPESDLVVAGTGHAGFINGWLQHLQANLQGATIDDLNTEAPNVFRASLRAEGGLSGLTATIYHFGYSLVERKYIGFAYRSTADFQSERLPYDCLGIKPEIKIELPDSLTVPGLFVDLMTKQQLADQRLPINQQVGIGGEVEFVVLRNQSIHIETAYRFGSYVKEAQYIESLGGA